MKYKLHVLPYVQAEIHDDFWHQHQQKRVRVVAVEMKFRLIPRHEHDKEQRYQVNKRNVDGDHWIQSCYNRANNHQAVQNLEK